MKQYRLLSYIWSGMFLGVFLVPVFIAGTWFTLLNADSPDVPDESWLDPILSGIAFCGYYPIGLLHPIHRTAGLGFPFLQIGLDAVFWGFVIVSLYEMTRRRTNFPNQRS